MSSNYLVNSGPQYGWTCVTLWNKISNIHILWPLIYVQHIYIYTDKYCMMTHIKCIYKNKTNQIIIWFNRLSDYLTYYIKNLLQRYVTGMIEYICILIILCNKLYMLWRTQYFKLHSNITSIKFYQKWRKLIAKAVIFSIFPFPNILKRKIPLCYTVGVDLLK